jgi:protein-tyrosine phosphatase
VERISFVDCHTHVVPSYDDGAQSIDEGLALCRDAARHGTGILYATPHVSPRLPLTVEREEEVRAAHEQMCPHAGLDLRLGFELTPMEPLLEEDPERYALPGTRCVLVEMPFVGTADLMFEVGEHVERAGLGVVIAHPERTEALLSQPSLADEVAGRGWLMQVNSTSLLGRHGPEIRALAWELVEDGRASMVASDGHRTTRPARLDDAFAAVRRRVGERAGSFFDGSAIGLASPRPGSSRAASRAV